MKREAIDFYKENNTPLEKLIVIGVERKGLTAASITTGAEQLHTEIQGGLNVPSVRIAWEVFSRAKILKGRVEKIEIDKTIELENELDDLTQKYLALDASTADTIGNLRDLLGDAEKEIRSFHITIDRYLSELEWYHQPWWKTIFRRPPNG
jgi:hypothetical protein